MRFFDNDTVTLFNYYMNPDTEDEKYFITVLENVDLIETKGANVTKSGTDRADAATLYIDFSNLPKRYMGPKEWEAIPEDEKGKYITFQSSTDFFVKGSCTGATFPDRELYQWLRDNFDGVYKITNVDKYDSILPHFEVGGV